MQFIMNCKLHSMWNTLRKKLPCRVVLVRLKSNKIQDESQLPEFVYAGKNIKPHTRVYVMGVTTNGALGVRHFLQPNQRKNIYKFVNFPFRLVFADLHKVDEIACGYGFTILGMKRRLNESPALYGTGLASSCQIGYHSRRPGHSMEVIIEPSPIHIPLTKGYREKKIACGRAHSLIWTDSEGLWTFGNNSFGQCGRPIVKEECYKAQVRYRNITMFNEKPVDQIECGQDTSFILSNGKIYSCGWSTDGQTGLNTFENVENFTLVEGDLKGENVIKISSKADCVLALTDKGDVFGWGNSEYRQLGSITEDLQVNTPKKLILKNIEAKIVDIASAGSACYAVTESGDVWSWGYGALGVGPEETHSIEPKMIPSTLLGRNILNKDSKVMKIFAGVSFAAAVTNQGGLYTWGRNSGGCLGLGHSNFQYFPMRVCVASSVVKVSCGVDHIFVTAKSLI